jgi:hypothetical protein
MSLSNRSRWSRSKLPLATLSARRSLESGNGSSTVVLTIDPAPDQRRAGAKDASLPNVISTSAIVAESTRRGLVLTPRAAKRRYRLLFRLMHPNFIFGRFWPIKINVKIIINN